MIATREPAGQTMWSRLSWLAVTAAVMAVIWVITATSMLIWTAGAPAVQTHRLVIPAGTSSDVESGRNPLAIPSTWAFFEGDTLILDNRDRVAHQVGGWLVGPGSVTSVILESSIGGSLFCTLHPSGAINLNVQMRGFDWRLSLVPTLMAGLPLGLAAPLGIRVWRALDDSDLIPADEQRRDRP